MKNGGLIVGYVTDAKYTGGSNGSRGYSFQDKVAIKYIFEYLDQGLKEISLESADDFCIVLDDGKKMYCQVKINQFTPGFIKGLINDVKLSEKTYFIGSGFNDDFRKLVQYKERYMDLKKGHLLTDKNDLTEEIKQLCNKEGLNCNAFLTCEFDEISSFKAEEIAKAYIDKWARKRKKFIDTDNLYNYFMVLCDKKRASGGSFSIDDINNIISEHSTSKLTSFIPKQQRVSVVVEERCKNEIEKMIDFVIREKRRFEKELLLIKVEVLNEEFVEAKNHIEEVLDCVPSLKPLYYMVLNSLGLYDEVISCIDNNTDPECLFEYAKAYYLKKDFTNSQKCIELIDKELLDSNVLCISGTNNRMLGNVERAFQDLEEAINLDSNNIDAYIQLAELFYNSGDFDSAASNCDKAMRIDKNYPNVYMFRAKICVAVNDFKGVVDNLKKYLLLSNDENNDEMLLKIAAYGYCANLDNCGILFFRWNQAYRHNNKVSDTRVIEYPNSVGSIGGYRFRLITKKTKLIVFANENKVYVISTSGEYSRTGVGLYVNPINFQMYEAVFKEHANPLENSKEAIQRKASIPIISKIYDDENIFKKRYEELKANSAVHLNHEYAVYNEEYIVDKEAVDINITVYGMHLTGYAKIGDVMFNLDINPLTNDSFYQFKDKVEKDKKNIEAALILNYGENYVVQYTFSKDAISIQME